MARRARPLGKVGGLTKKDRAGTVGFDDLKKRIRRLSDQSQRDVVVGATKEMAEVLFDTMHSIAPRSDGNPSRGDRHAADAIIIEKLRAKRNSRRIFVGLGHEVSWWLMWEEIDASHLRSNTQFIRPTRDRHRGDMKKIFIKWMRRTVNGLGPINPGLDK